MPLIAFDMDGVLLECKSSWEWVHSHFGVSNEENLHLFIDGKIDDREFIKRDVDLWRQALGREPTMADIQPYLRNVPIRKGAIETIRHLKDMGFIVGIVSGGIYESALRIKEECDCIDFIKANRLVVEDGVITGDSIVEVPLLEKDRVMAEVLKQFGIQKKDAVSVGDSFTDIGLFRMSDFAIAFNPMCDEVAREADVVIISEDLRDIIKPIEEWFDSRKS